MTSALQLAITQLGVQEATGNNDGIPAARYNHGEEKAWCAAFVTWLFKTAGNALPGNEYMNASVAYMEAQMIAAHAFFGRDHNGEWEQRPEPGDIVFFADRGASDRGAGRHVGIVESCDSSGTIRTIEGNLGNKVQRAKHNIFVDKRVVGFARWVR